jgi:hypothetical protein
MGAVRGCRKFNNGRPWIRPKYQIKAYIHSKAFDEPKHEPKAQAKAGMNITAMKNPSTASED